MKNSIKLTIITCLLISNVISQEKGNGFGFTFNGSGSIENYGGYMSPTVYYIYNLSNGNRIEPSLGYISSSSNDETESIITAGVGYLKNRSQSDNFSTYWGSRFAMTMNSEADNHTISISPACGAEYSFSNNFSIGGETRFNILMSGDDDDSSISYIGASLFFRFYK